MKKFFGALLIIGVLIVSGVKLFAKPPVTGTCCPSIGPICVIGNFAFHDYYYLDSGPCNDK